MLPCGSVDIKLLFHKNPFQAVLTLQNLDHVVYLWRAGCRRVCSCDRSYCVSWAYQANHWGITGGRLCAEVCYGCEWALLLALHTDWLWWLSAPKIKNGKLTRSTCLALNYWSIHIGIKQTLQLFIQLCICSCWCTSYDFRCLCTEKVSELWLHQAVQG